MGTGGDEEDLHHRPTSNSVERRDSHVADGWPEIVGEDEDDIGPAFGGGEHGGEKGEQTLPRDD